MLEAQDYSHPQSQEPPQDYNQNPETAQYSTTYFMSREKLPQVKCNSLKTAVSRLGANEQSEHIQPVWIAQSQSSKKHQVDVEIDTGAGCNVIPTLFLKKVIKNVQVKIFVCHDLQFITFNHSVTFTYDVFSHFFVCSIMIREVMCIGSYYCI